MPCEHISRSSLTILVEKRNYTYFAIIKSSNKRNYLLRLPSSRARIKYRRSFWLSASMFIIYAFTDSPPIATNYFPTSFWKKGINTCSLSLSLILIPHTVSTYYHHVTHCERGPGVTTARPSLSMICLNCSLLISDTEFWNLAFGTSCITFSYILERIANDAFHQTNDILSVVLSALCKQAQVWILFSLRARPPAVCLPAEKSPLTPPPLHPVRLLPTAPAAIPHRQFPATWLPVTGWFTWGDSLSLKHRFHRFGRDTLPSLQSHHKW